MTVFDKEQNDDVVIRAFDLDPLHSSTVERLYRQDMSESEVMAFFKFNKTVATRIAMGRYSEGDYPNELYAPITLMRGVYGRVLAKRGQTFREYVEYIVNQNRRQTNKKRYGGAEVPSRMVMQTLNQVIDVIDQLTRKSPKARAAFESKLNPLNVYLPKLDDPATTQHTTPQPNNEE